MTDHILTLPEVTGLLKIAERIGHRVPSVNNLEKFGRWAFVEFTAAYEMEAKFDKLLETLGAGKVLIE
jgi:hypothetical protein